MTAKNSPDTGKHQVSNVHRNSNFAELDQAVIHELHQLCTRLHDEVIFEQELARLNQLLDDFSAARKFYLRYVTLHSMMLTSTGKQQRVEAEELSRHITQVEQNENSDRTHPLADTLLSEEQPGLLGLRQQSVVTWAIAAMLLIAASATIWAVRETDVDFAEAHHRGRVQRPTDPAPGVVRIAPAVRLSYISSNARWQPNGAFQPVTALSPGDQLNLLEGEIELTYNTGTKLLLVAPAEFLVQAAGGQLRSGGLVTSVTDAGHGFTIETPNGKVVDLGTEFGVVVDDFGVSEVSVFQGKVEAFPLGKHIGSKKVELTKGRGLQWDEDAMIPLNANLRRFAASVLPRTPGLDLAESQTSLSDEFLSPRLDTAKWRVLGDVRATRTGLDLRGRDAGNQPYLITADPYDPSRSPLTITCDFQFAKLGPAVVPAFSMLTRSSAERGIAAAPWRGTLASCVRCSFSSDPQSGDGILQAGVKLETDREMANISWSGFLRPVAETPYRIVMRDDGVKISFTVSLRDNPSVSKTVTCRSLFQGKANYVAFEGAASGLTRIERVEISRDPIQPPLSRYADFCSRLSNASRQRNREERLLREWTPENSVLILDDDFHAPQLDGSKWTCLGDIQAGGGAIQLGLPNAEAHIDTWKPRPYLLTRKRLDPGAGSLTIVGKIQFAKNFLAGYGASFAVMTRANDQRGQGPGWEHSVLQRGIRANFWPAAWDSKHSLEIHEKPTSNTLILLATEGLEANPQVRSYLFRVVDDGQSVTLTIVDPRRPKRMHRISASTTSTLRTGYVGFESCWGSPVTLDKVRIYQTRASTNSASVPASSSEPPPPKPEA